MEQKIIAVVAGREIKESDLKNSCRMYRESSRRIFPIHSSDSSVWISL